MRRLLFFCTALIGLAGPLFAQTTLIRTDLIPASPTAGSIAHAGEVPLNLSTGLPSLSIPIFNVQGNDLSLAISLNYSYEGFRPAQAASWVGQGWNLDAGGVITRQVRDKIDGTMGAGDYNGSTVQSAILSPSAPSQTFLQFAPVMYDLEPDIYNFSFPGYSGKFIRHNGKFYVFPSQKLKITTGGSDFSITTENGTVYYFSEVETTSPKGSSGSPYNIPSHTSAWYLTRITNPTGNEQIQLYYTSEGTLSNGGALTQTYRKDINMMYDTYPGDPGSSFPTYVNPVRLSSIVSDKYVVSFTPGTGRLDLNQGFGGAAKSLSAITVASAIGEVKTFRLRQHYDGGTYNKYLVLDSLQEYPRLLDVDETGPLPDTLTHRFEYQPMSDISRRNAHVDHFGFSKGAGMEFAFMLLPNTMHSEGVDREPNLDGTKQGAMTKIVYPSGGYTEFNYQLNTIPEGSGYELDSYALGTNLSRPSGGINTVEVIVGNFAIGQTQSIDVMVVRTPHSEQGDGFTRNVDNDFEISNSTGTVFYGKIGLEADNAGKTFTTILGPGTYTLKLAADWRESEMSVLLNYTGVSSRVIEGKKSGGLRVSKMVTHAQTGPPLVREYSYANPQGFSTGVAPSSSYDVRPFHQINVGPDNPVGQDFYYMVISSYISESPTTGIPHYYRSVLEKQVSVQDTLFTRHDFIAFDGTFMGTAPKKVTQYRKNGLGQLVSATAKTYDYHVVQDTVLRGMRTFQTMQVNNTGAWWSGPTEEFDYTDSFVSNEWRYLKSTREVIYEGNDSLITVTNNSYDANRNLAHTTATGSNGEVLVSKFKYPESYTSDFNGLLARHILSPVIEQQQWNKKGTDSVLVSGSLTEYSATVYKPVKQYMLSTAGISALDNETMTGMRYTSFLSDTRYEERASYTYSANGSLISQQLTGGFPISYKWGHAGLIPAISPFAVQQNYPVAEARNALPAEMYFENFEEHSSATTGIANSGNNYYSGDFYLDFTIPNGRSYVVSYFYRSGGKWLYRAQPYTGAVTLGDGDAIDDVAVYPADAQLSSYAYYDGIGNRSVIDAKGNMASYEYDKMNRLLNIRDQNGDIVKNYRYNYGTDNGLYYNTVQTASFSKSGCGYGLVGTSVSYTVAANTYSSAISQAAADAQATIDLAGNGQAYANANGTCVAGITVTYQKDATPDAVDITQIQVKDGSGNLLYTFDQGQVMNGFAIPQGTYTFSITIAPSAPGSPQWSGTIATSATSSYFNQVPSQYVYNVTGLVLTQSTAAISFLNLL